LITTLLSDFTFMIKVLVVTSILMFISIFTVMPKVIGFFLLIWVANVFWNLKLLLNSSGLGLADFTNSVGSKINEARTEKKHFQKALYFITIPMMTIGMIMVGLIIVAYFTIL